MNALALTFGLLTAFPVRRLPHVDARAARWAMVLAPLTTLPILAGIWVAHLLDRPLLAAVLVVGGSALWTRGMHLDGLADTADGLSVQGERAHRLAAMKASDIGPSGVAALVLVLLVQVAALAVLLPTEPLLAGLAWLTSRVALAVAAHPLVPPATREGLGAMVSGSVGTAWLLGVIVLLLGAAVVADPTRGPLMVAAGLLSAVLLLRRATARFGGVTGDVLGACVEVALVGALVVGAVA